MSVAWWRLRLTRRLIRSPAHLAVAGFAGLIGGGAFLLALPAASTGPPLAFVDALFTATSAGCVTGLAVVDTGTAFSLFGQVVLLGLIQAGGLGILTLSTLLLLIAGKRPSPMGRILIQDTFTHGSSRGPSAIIRDVVRLTLVIEAVGALLLFFGFLGTLDPAEAAYQAVFHSISAFCNAGFSLFPNSFEGYRESVSLNLTLIGLIIAGGLGFLVLAELGRTPGAGRRRWSRLSLHSKLVLSTTGVLLLGSTLMVLAFEWHNTLAPLSVPGRFLAAFFQGVTTRTAGFNTLPVGEMANATLFGFILLMFIGASPGSCGGGIKTTTAAGLVFLGISRFRHRLRTQVFSRTLADTSLSKAMSLVLVSLMVIIIATGAILVSELGEISHVQSRGKFLELFFEVVSAFATVGLSTGVTGGLTVVGKLIITAVMFIGRLGPLVIVVAISRPRQSAPFYYATERVMVG